MNDLMLCVGLREAIVYEWLLVHPAFVSTVVPVAALMIGSMVAAVCPWLWGLRRSGPDV